jgi:ATP sulfurylase
VAERIGGIRPHGGQLVDRRLRGVLRDAALDRAPELPKVRLTSMGVSDLELISVGAFSPLMGFMNKADYESVIESMHLANGLAWTIPVTLPVDDETASSLHEGAEVALMDGERVLGLMSVTDIFRAVKEREAREVYRTTDEAHPGVARLVAQGDWLLGGEVWMLNQPRVYEFPELRHDPAQTRRIFASQGWRRIVAFQTRNPIHRAHEYIQKTALEIVDGLFLHPLVGETKADDIPADVRIESYQAILRDYYPADRVLLGVFPAAMRYAGPREAIFHALARKNYGCTHFIVGRDHAGVGKYYGTYDAHSIFDEFEPGELGITPLFFDYAFYCRKCGAVVSPKTCPHGEDDWVFLSGTQVRDMLERGETLPEEFTRPEVARVLLDGVQRHKREREQARKRAVRRDNGVKVFVIGLDCAEPTLVFDRWKAHLPNFRQLMEGGIYGDLRSTIPPITVPAWSCMLSSKDPGQLGVYGFRNRADFSYDKMGIATSRAVRHDRIWDILSRAGKRVVLVGVPQTYPVTPVNGAMISSFLTPSTRSQFTYPASLESELERVLDGEEWMLDVRNFRTEDKDRLLDEIYQMADQHHKAIKHLMTTKPWDFFMFVDMGVDRIHHGFWKYFDPAHPKYPGPGNRYETAILDYYKHLDAQVGELLSLLDEDTVVLVVSDHGGKAMVGGICFNEWLIQEGYLTLKEQPEGIVPLQKCEVDWDKTLAWGSGGYYARLFLNVRGREPTGIIDMADYERVQDELAAKISALTDPEGNNIGSVALKPKNVYRQIHNIPPDLIVLFGNLSWRSVGILGLNSIHTFENDTGPDDANHAQNGLYIVHDPLMQGRGRGPEQAIFGVAPTILELMGLPVPADMIGGSLVR